MNTGNVAEGVGNGFINPRFHFSQTFIPVALLTLVMANIGTTITPWQIFFQHAAGANGTSSSRSCRRKEFEEDKEFKNELAVQGGPSAST